MKIRLACIGLVLAGLCLTGPMAPPAKAADRPIVLTLSLGMPPIHQRWVKVLQPWCEELQKRSNGRLVVEPYFADSLGKRSEAMNSVRTGIADMAEATFGANPGQFPFHSQIFSAASPSKALNNSQEFLEEFYTDFPELLTKEISGVKLLFTHSYPVGDCIMTKKAPVRTIADLKGKKIGFEGGGLRFEKVKSLGVSVVGMSMADLYQGMQSGVIDGIAMDFDPLISRRYGEEVKHVTLLNITGTGFYLVMNQKKYDSLPDDLKKVIDDMSEYGSQKVKEFWAENVYGSLEKWINEMGGTVYMLSDDDYAKADSMVEKPIEAWFKSLEQAGYPAQKMQERFYQLEDKYFTPWKQAEVVKYVKE